MKSVFPECTRDGCAIIGEFPPSCPLGDPDRGAARLRELRRQSFWDPTVDPRRAVVLDRIFHVCNLCVSALSAHPHIKELRGDDNGQ